MKLTAEQNRALTLTGPGTPMGRLFRSYWIPALLASEVPDPDGAPVRVRLLSEKLVAFRDSQGRLGLVEEFCAHRGVSLWFGRNEEGGLRCPYHGWKYDVTGQCVEVPSEPPESAYCARIRLKSYPLLDRGGVLWTYMGDPATQPPAPAHDWATLPASHVYASKRIQACNWLQAMEGGLDSIHSTFLHRYSVGEDPLLKRDPVSAALLQADPLPVFIPAESPGGLYIATRRNAGDERYYWRVTQWLMPCFNLFAPYEGNPHGGHAWVPIDDEHCWTFSVDYRPDRPLGAAELEAMHQGAGIHAKLIPGTFVPVANRENDYLMDRQAQAARKTFSGVATISIQDAAVQESMGAIEDRTRENVVSTDNGIIKTRQRLLRALADLERGVVPPGRDASQQRQRAFSAVVPRSATLDAVVAQAQQPGPAVNAQNEAAQQGVAS
jgi:phenylpropionate dioxygenase-like ring-hydroxylating dioxygenase large terminal subunit